MSDKDWKSKWKEVHKQYQDDDRIRTELQEKRQKMKEKLTGKEAVIALMQGKKVREASGDVYYYDENGLFCSDPSGENTHVFYGDDFGSIFEHDEWEIVIEPRVWEGVLEGRLGGMVLGGPGPVMPDWMLEKKFKVRAEEIL